MFLVVGVEIYCKIRGAFVSEKSEIANVDKVQAIHSRLGLFFQVRNVETITCYKIALSVGTYFVPYYLHHLRSSWCPKNCFKCDFQIFIWGEKRTSVSRLMVAEFGKTLKFSLSTLQAGATPASKCTATRHASFYAYVNPLYTENLSQITFRLLELGAILWFPCILWNCNNPEKLWALNPKKLLLPDAQMGHINETEVTLRDRNQDNVSKNDCWICYDPSHDSDLINPCKCKVKIFWITRVVGECFIYGTGLRVM